MFANAGECATALVCNILSSKTWKKTTMLSTGEPWKLFRIISLNSSLAQNRQLTPACTSSDYPCIPRRSTTKHCTLEQLWWFYWVPLNHQRLIILLWWLVERLHGHCATALGSNHHLLWRSAFRMCVSMQHCQRWSRGPRRFPHISVAETCYDDRR